MNKSFCILTILICFLFTCSAQVNRGQFGVGHDKKTLVAFFLDGKQVEIKDEFKLFFINGKDTFTCMIKGVQAIPPVISVDSGYTVFFAFKNDTLCFDRISRLMIAADQDITWKFGIDNYPFHQSLDLLSNKNYEEAIKMKVKQIQYLQFDLMEYGDGIQFIKKIK